MDKFSYAIGLGIGQNLLSMGAKGIAVDDFAQAIKDVLEGNQTAISHTEARDIVNKYFAELEEKMNAANIEAGKKFLEENKKREGVVTLPSGLQYEVITEGNVGHYAKATDQVQCHYEGTLIDGTLFDSSIKRGQPATFGVNQVIPGWVEALQLMPEGAKWKLYIPSDLAYGAQGAGEMIPPHSTLVFEVELQKILSKETTSKSKMKKVTFLMALAVAAGMASCTAQSPKADLKTDIDSLSYAIGMARTEGLDQYLAQQGIDSTQMSEFLKGFNEGAAKIDKKDVAYMAGLQVGQMVSKQWVEGFNQQIFGNDSTQSISRENLLAGFVAGVIGKGGAMDMMKAQEYMRTQMDAIKEKATAEKYADNKAAGEKFLAENKAKEGVVTTPSGLQYKIITKGNGAVPADSSKVKVNYKGTLIDGTEFDSSYKRNEPATFRANQVIKGWTEALTMMPVGSKWELYIPYDLAYGSRETGSQIKPFSTLIFEVELLGIEK